MLGKAQADLGARRSSGDWLKIYLDQRRTQERLSKPFAQGAEKLCKKKRYRCPACVPAEGSHVQRRKWKKKTHQGVKLTRVPGTKSGHVFREPWDSLPVLLILCVRLWGPQSWAKWLTTRSPWGKAQFVGFADFHVVNIPTMVDFSWQRIHLQYGRPHFNSWVGKIHWRRDRLPTPIFWAGKESASNVGYLGSIPGLGRSPGEGKGYPLQYSDLENSMESQRVRHD